MHLGAAASADIVAAMESDSFAAPPPLAQPALAMLRGDPRNPLGTAERSDPQGGLNR